MSIHPSIYPIHIFHIYISFVCLSALSVVLSLYLRFPPAFKEQESKHKLCLNNTLIMQIAINTTERQVT